MAKIRRGAVHGVDVGLHRQPLTLRRRRRCWNAAHRHRPPDRPAACIGEAGVGEPADVPSRCARGGGLLEGPDGVDPHRSSGLQHRVCGAHQLRLLLGVEAVRVLHRPLQPVLQRAGDAWLAGLVGVGDHPGEIAQGTLVPVRLVVEVEAAARLNQGVMRPRPVAHQIKGRADLRLGQGRRLGLHLHVMPPTQAGQIPAPGLGHDIEGVGGGTAAHSHGRLPGVVLVAVPSLGIFKFVGDGGEAVRPGNLPHGAEGAVISLVRHGGAQSLGLDQKVSGVGPQPGIRLAVADPPKTEGAVEGLAVEQLAHRLIQCGDRPFQARVAGHLGGVEQWIGR